MTISDCVFQTPHTKRKGQRWAMAQHCRRSGVMSEGSSVEQGLWASVRDGPAVRPSCELFKVYCSYSVPAEAPPSPYELYIGMQEHLYPFLQCMALLFRCTTGIQFVHSSGTKELCIQLFSTTLHQCRVQGEHFDDVIEAHDFVLQESCETPFANVRRAQFKHMTSLQECCETPLANTCGAQFV